MPSTSKLRLQKLYFPCGHWALSSATVSLCTGYFILYWTDLFSSPCQRLEMQCCMKTICNIGWQSLIIASNILSSYRKNFKTNLFLATERIQATPCGCYPGIYWVENSLTNYRKGQTQSVNQKTMYITIYICFPVEKTNRNINFTASSVEGKNDCFYELCMNHKNQNKTPPIYSTVWQISQLAGNYQPSPMLCHCFWVIPLHLLRARLCGTTGTAQGKDPKQRMQETAEFNTIWTTRNLVWPRVLQQGGSLRRCEMLILSTSYLFCSSHSKHGFVPAVLLLSSALISSHLLARKRS